MGKQWKKWETLFFLSFKITPDGDCNHEIKRRLLLGREVTINLHSTLKSRNITLSAKVCLVKAMVFPVVMYGCESWTIKKAEHRRIDAFEMWCWEDSWESLVQQGNPTSPFWRRSVLNIHWKDWCWSWNSDTLAAWCRELTHWERPWCWERLKVRGEEDDRGLGGWMASPTQWTSVWVNSRSWLWTRRPGMLLSMGLQSWTCLSDWIELNWTSRLLPCPSYCEQCWNECWGT